MKQINIVVKDIRLGDRAELSARVAARRIDNNERLNDHMRGSGNHAVSIATAAAAPSAAANTALIATVRRSHGCLHQTCIGLIGVQ